MRFVFFTIPIHGGEDAGAGLNRFLSGHRILSVERQFIADGPNSAWAICVCFDDAGDTPSARTGINRRGKVDFREVLSDPEFACLRALRKLFLSRFRKAPPLSRRGQVPTGACCGKGCGDKSLPTQNYQLNQRKMAERVGTSAHCP